MPKIIQVIGAKYDLFFGEGWEDWTRVVIQRGKDGHVKYHSGKPREQFKLDLVRGVRK